MNRQWSEELWEKANQIVEQSSSTKEADRRLREELGKTYEAFRARRKRLSRKIEEDKKSQQFREELLELRRKYRELLSLSNFEEKILNQLDDRIQRWNAFLPKAKSARLESSDDLEHNKVVLLLGDLHIGEVVSLEETSGISEYNFDIFRKRLQLLSDQINTFLFQKLCGYNFDEIVVICLGDMVSGNIIDELIETNDPEVTDQVVDGAYILAQFLQEQAQRFPQVVVHGIPGNHGRLKRKKQYKRRYASWDRVMYKMIGSILRQQDNISFHFPKSLFGVAEICGAKFLYTHGDEIRSWMGIPWYGMERDRRRKQELAYRIPDLGHFDYMILGHFHTCVQMDAPSGEIIVNGSFVGGDEYSIGRLGRAMEPSQIIFGVDAFGKITWRHPIRLGDISMIEEIRYLLPEEVWGEPE